MNHYDAMRLFVQAAETASFTQAAGILGVPKASVSNAVKQLETRLGARLFTRTTRRVALTQEGRMCLDRCKDILADMDELDSLFATGKTVGGRQAFDLGAAADLRLHLLGELHRHGRHLPARTAGGDHHVIGDAGLAGERDRDGLDRLIVLKRLEHQRVERLGLR